MAFALVELAGAPELPAVDERVDWASREFWRLSDQEAVAVVMRGENCEGGDVCWVEQWLVSDDGYLRFRRKLEGISHPPREVRGHE